MRLVVEHGWSLMELRSEMNEAGRRGELQAERGDLEGALRTWAEAYGESAPTTKRLAEVLAENGDLNSAVAAWTSSDAMRNNPLGRHQAYVDSLPAEDRWEATEDGVGPEGWEFYEMEQLAALLADRGDEAAMAELRARAADGDWPARKKLAELEQRPNE